MLAIIESEFQSAGLPAEIAAAAMINAYHESRLNPLAKAGAAGEDSVGLFQLNARGAGHGMATAARQDPVLNTQRIIEVVKGSQGRALLAAHAAGERSVAQFSRLFAQHVERCAACGYQSGSGELDRRAATSRQWFPGDHASYSLLAVSNPWLWLPMVTVAVVGGALGLRWYLQSR
jgi:hypothetical protein